MYNMKQVCDKIGLSYDTLKYYCNEGLVPNLKRDKNNYRIFDDKDIAWIDGLSCLKDCGMSIKEMKDYLELCLLGESSIPKRKLMLEKTYQNLKKKEEEITKSLNYINNKQTYYDDILSGKTKYTSNLIKND